MVCANHSWLSHGCPALVKLHRSTAGIAPAETMRRPVARCHHRSELRMTLKQNGRVQAAPASSQRRWRPCGSRRSGVAGWRVWSNCQPIYSSYCNRNSRFPERSRCDNSRFFLRSRYANDAQTRTSSRAKEACKKTRNTETVCSKEPSYRRARDLRSLVERCDDAIASPLLGEIEGLVGLLDEHCRVPSRGWQQGGHSDADGKGGSGRRRVLSQRSRRDALAEVLGDPQRPRRVRAGEEQHEFLAAVAGREAPGALRDGGQHRGHLAQALVARLVAVTVVVRLEVVDVDHDQGQPCGPGIADPGRAGPFREQVAVEAAAVGDPGQAVDLGQAREPRIGVPQLSLEALVLADVQRV